MKPVLIAGITIVNLALLSYTTAIVIQNRTRSITSRTLLFLTIGVILDITSTICMIIGSGHFITLHGIIGYSSLAGMLADTYMSWRHASNVGKDAAISPAFKRWSNIAYSYWILAYITGAILVMIK